MPSVPPEEVPQAVESRLHAACGGTLARVDAAADAVAADWGGATTADRAAVVPAVSRELDARGVTAVLPAVLESAVTATGRELTARPVPAPPYVLVTARGPVLRATLGDGRLVVTLSTFDVVRNGDGPRHVRSPGVDVDVAFVR